MCTLCERIGKLTKKHQQVAQLTHSWQPVSYLGTKCTICSLGVCQVYILYNSYIHTNSADLTLALRNVSTAQHWLSRHQGLLNLETCVTHCVHCTLWVTLCLFTPISTSHIKCTICTSHKLDWLDAGCRLLIAWCQHQGKLLISSVQFVHHMNSLG